VTLIENSRIDFPLTIKLDKPVRSGDKGEPLDMIVVRAPTLGDIRDVKLDQAIDFSQILKVAARLITNAPKGEERIILDKLGREGAQITSIARNFISDCL
jgi:hypothetical protein